MATMCVEGCKAVCAGKKWKLVANPDVYKHEKWKDAEMGIKFKFIWKKGYQPPD